MAEARLLGLLEQVTRLDLGTPPALRQLGVDILAQDVQSRFWPRPGFPPHDGMFSFINEEKLPSRCAIETIHN